MYSLDETVPDETDAVICACGQEIPHEGFDFEPNCRFCARLRVDRRDRALAERERDAEVEHG